MLCCAASRRRSSCATLAALAALAGLAIAATAPRAVAQIAPGDGVPSRVYFAALPVYHDGDYRDSAASFLNASRSGIKTVDSRWIDSICYLTMAGESYYQLGQLEAALDSYNSALKIYLAYSGWMMRVQFTGAITPAATRAAPWGQSRRGARMGQFPDTFLMGQGQVDQSAVVFQGGVVQNPVLFPVHVAEIVRCTSLAIRRRGELLGPIAKYDRMSNELVSALERRPGPPNHWSQAWINVQLGCAYAAVGNSAQATATLQQALNVGGEFDHPLASTAWVALGHVALQAGDFSSAARYFEEATYSCVNFPNPGNLEEAFHFGLVAHLMANQKVPYLPLVPAIAWSKAQGLRQLQTSLLLLGAEHSATLGDTAQASTLLGNARALIGRSDLGAGRLGASMNHLAALTAYQAGNVAAGDQAIGAALSYQQAGSLWLFQIALADSRYMHGDFSDRVGLMLYETLLRDPLPADWTSNPLECLSVLATPHGAVLEHWFETVIKNGKDQDLALEIADRARRHRFFSTLPLGGRLLALRWILEGPLELLGERGMLERHDILTRYPKYVQLSQQAAKIRADLSAKPLVVEGVEARREQASQLASLAEISQSQEVMLREIAVRREPAEMVFPPLRKTKDLQQSLSDGQVLLAFFATNRNLYAFLYSNEKYAAWRIQSPATLHKQIIAMLREMGNFDANHELTPAELAKGAWRTTSAKLVSLLLEKSNVDLAGNFDEIVIVPDGILWYLPFEVLRIGKSGHERMLISQARVRYAPTVGLAVPFGQKRKGRSSMGVVVGKLSPRDDEALAGDAMDELARSVPGAVALPRSLSALSAYRTLLDSLIVLDDIPSPEGPYDWSPAPSDRGKAAGSLASWFSLPWGGPEQVILPGFHTAAENALRKGQPTGQEMFLSLCGLMSTGARTILISRWRLGGQTSVALVRELAQELPHLSPAEAWQRSVQMATETQLEPEHEPRLKKPNSTSAANADAPKADHPLFWAGYMLVDSGVAAEGHDKPPADPAAPLKKAQPANPPPAPPAARLPAAADAVPDEIHPEKPARRARPEPRASPKKATPRKKAAPPEQPE